MDENTTAPSPATSTLFASLKAETLAKTPIFAHIVETYGDKTVFDYAQHFFMVKRNPLLIERRKKSLPLIRQQVAIRFGDAIGQEVAEQLAEKPVLNTTDHHAIVDHPFWLNTEIVTSFGYQNLERTDAHMIVLSFASVSQNNASGFPRGLLLHGGSSGEGDMLRLPLLPDRTKMSTVYGTPSYTSREVDNAIALLRTRQKEGIIGAARADSLTYLMRELLLDPSVLSEPDFSSQISRINYLLWPRFFSGDTASLPSLIYLDIETLVAQMFLQDFLHDSTSLPYRMLFDPAVRQLFWDRYRGLPGAYSIRTQEDGTPRQYGTFLFWGRDTKGYRLSLALEGSALVSTDGSIRIPLTPEDIRAALTDLRIFPSSMTAYTIMALYYGYKCLGGFSQVTDLTRMKDAYLTILRDIGTPSEEIEEVENVQTKEFSGDGIVLSYYQDAAGNLTASTGIDLVLADKRLSYQDYVHIAQNLTFTEALAPLIPEMYTVFVHSDHRDPIYSSLNETTCMEITGLKQKLLTLFAEKNLA